jgi:hypothetical protein
LDKGKTPYNLRNCAYLQEFEKEKVVYSEIVREPQFHFDINNFYAEATSFLMSGESTKYLICLLNSKFVTWSFKLFYAGGGLGESGYRYKKAFLENLPVPKIPKSQKQPFIELVDKILLAKQRGADTRELENEIDAMVFDLYQLTEQEMLDILLETKTSEADRRDIQSYFRRLRRV